MTPEDVRLAKERAVLRMPLTEVSGITVRVINTLDSAGIARVGELASRRATDLLSLPNFGEKTLVEVRAVLKGLGVKVVWRLPARKRRRKR